MKKLFIHLFSFFSILISYQYAIACTDFITTAKDGTNLITRSMEFALDLKSNIRSSTRGRQFTSTTPNGKPGYSWKAKYGYIFIDGLDQDMSIDGMNENGLSFEYLYLPGETSYQTVPADKDNQAIPYLQLGDWVLSNFKTVDEVRQALASMYVFEQTLPGMGNTIFPLHAAIYDATGKGIIVEFIGGKMHIYDSIGMLTNSPSYDWQVTNLRNYINLSPYSPKPVVVNNLVFTATGQGSGMVGLPGDISPPSRFVKISFLAKVSYPTNDASGALNLAEHIINNVDIPLGLARANVNGNESAELTQWVVFKDLTHRVFYYRTYNDMTLRSVALDKISFSESAPRLKMPLADTPYIMDMTAKFLNAKVN